MKLEWGSAQIAFPALEGPDRAFAVLSNRGPAETVAASFTGQYGRVVNALSGAELKLARANGKVIVTAPLSAGEVLVLEAQRGGAATAP